MVSFLRSASGRCSLALQPPKERPSYDIWQPVRKKLALRVMYCGVGVAWWLPIGRRLNVWNGGMVLRDTSSCAGGNPGPLPFNFRQQFVICVLHKFTHRTHLSGEQINCCTRPPHPQDVTTHH